MPSAHFYEGVSNNLPLFAQFTGKRADKVPNDTRALPIAMRIDLIKDHIANFKFFLRASSFEVLSLAWLLLFVVNGHNMAVSNQN